MSIFCKHEWAQVGPSYFYNNYSKAAPFQCLKCGKKRFFDIFKVPKNTYIFKEYTKGDISDGSHTFNELYHHRMVLFSIICNVYSSISWKSWKHHDGTMYDDYFIVGIDTPEGQYSYHYHKDNWNLFNVQELKNAPEWDGHKSGDIDRLVSLITHDISRL